MYIVHGCVYDITNLLILNDDKSLNIQKIILEFRVEIEFGVLENTKF